MGAVLGPLLWNIGYNKPLNIISKNMHTTCFADDTMIILSAGTIEELKAKFTRYMTVVENTLKTHCQIKLNHSKMEILYMRVIKFQKEIPIFQIRGVQIQAKNAIKYLGIVLDHQLSYRQHFEYLEKKSYKIIRQIHTLFPNKYGYDTKARKIMFSGTIGSIWKYGSTIFAHKVNQSRNKCTIRRVHKACLRTICRSYRTVSYLPLTAITGITPLEYQITNRATAYATLKGIPIETTNNIRIPETLKSKSKKEIKKFLYNKTNDLWQQEWDNTQKGQWTQKLIPNVQESPTVTTYWLTQMYTGHGQFGSYIRKIDNTTNAKCQHCGKAKDTPEHTLYHCESFKEFRPERNLLTAGKPEFNKFVTKVMRIKHDPNKY